MTHVIERRDARTYRCTALTRSAHSHLGRGVRGTQDADQTCRQDREGGGDGSVVPGTEMTMKCCFTSTETVGLLRTGAPDVHLDCHTAPELLNSDTG